LGARIRAADLDTFEPYRLPKPLISKQFPKPGPGNRGIYDVVVIDPEDEDVPAEEPPERRRALGLGRSAARRPVSICRRRSAAQASSAATLVANVRPLVNLAPVWGSV